MQDEHYVRELYDASYRRLFGQLTAVTGSREEAEDVVQEAFARALLHARAARPPTSRRPGCAPSRGEHLFRSSDETWRHFTELPNPDGVDALVPAGDHVLGRGGSAHLPALLAYDGRGNPSPVTISR